MSFDTFDNPMNNDDARPQDGDAPADFLQSLTQSESDVAPVTAKPKKSVRQKQKRSAIVLDATVLKVNAD
jgi:hypothetical protein